MYSIYKKYRVRLSNLSNWPYKEKSPGMASFFEKIAKIGKFHAIRERKINAFGNFMKTCGQN